MNPIEEWKEVNLSGGTVERKTLGICTNDQRSKENLCFAFKGDFR